MKKMFFGIAVFISAFFIGILTAAILLAGSGVSDQTQLDAPQSVTVETHVNGAPKLDVPAFTPEFTDLPDFADIEYPTSNAELIELFEMEGIYHESEVLAKTGETWIVLFEQNGKYSLKSAKAKVQNLKTVSYPGDESDVRLTFDKPGIPIFAFKNIKSIKPGPVTTLYHRPSWEEISRRNLPITSMGMGFRQEFYLGKNDYTLRVSQGRTRSGIESNVLVLESNGVSQVVARNPGDIGALFWVGDIDNDGKLDLLFDADNEKGYFAMFLHLSSEAEDGKLVKWVATFEFAGC